MNFPSKKIIQVDWDFKDVKTQYLTHKYHSYPARFIPQIPRAIFDIFLKGKQGSTTFDPFLGCGTTVVEAVLSRHHCGGVDLNPLAVLLTRVKSTPLPPNKLKKYLDSFERMLPLMKTNSMAASLNQKTLTSFLNEQDEESGLPERDDSIGNSTSLKIKLPRMQNKPRTFDLPRRKLSERFTSDILHDISLILDWIDHEVDAGREFQDFFRVTLSSIITTHVESKKWKDNNLGLMFRQKARDMISIMEKFYERTKGFVNELQEFIRVHDARHVSFIDNESIDLIVTSPPYVNALDYHRLHQYNMVFLGYDHKMFARNEIGAHGHYISNRWRLLTEYLADMYRAIHEMARITKKNGVVCIVVGDSCIEYERIHTHQHLETIGKLVGLKHHLSIKRHIDQTSKHTSKEIGNIISEHVIFFSKEATGCERYDESLLHHFLEETLSQYLEHVKYSKGTCLRGRKPLTKERQQLAIQRVEEAISKIKEDSRWKTP